MKKHLFSALCILVIFSLLAGCKPTKDEEEIPIESTPVKNEMSVTVGEKTEDYSLALREIGEKKELVVFNEDESKQLMSIDISWDEAFGDKFAYTADVNFDGKKDILIPYQNPASAVYFKAYIYLPDEKNFAYAPAFETIPNFSLDNENKTVLGSRTASRITTYSVSKYSSEKKDFVIKNSVYYEPDGDDFKFSETEFAEDGSSTEKSFKVKPKNSIDIDETDKNVKSYFEAGSFWELGSEKWYSYYIYNLKAIDEFEKFLAGKTPAVRGVNQIWIADLSDSAEIESYAICNASGKNYPLLHIKHSMYTVFAYDGNSINSIYDGYLSSGNDVLELYSDGSAYCKCEDEGALSHWFLTFCGITTDTVKGTYFTYNEYGYFITDSKARECSEKQWRKELKPFMERTKSLKKVEFIQK